MSYQHAGSKEEAQGGNGKPHINQKQGSSKDPKAL